MRLIWRLLILTLLALALFVVVASLRLFVWPPTDRPTRSDAVVALGGDPGQRRAHYAIHLAQQGYAPVALISLGGRNVPCPPNPRGVEVICFRPNPVTTRGEAEHAASVAAERRWRRIIVVSERSQATRARLLFKRCTTVQIEMVPVQDRPGRLTLDVIYEWGALGKALFVNRGC